MVSGHFPLITTPWKIAPHEIPLGQLTPRTFRPGKLSLDISPWTATPQTTFPIKFPQENYPLGFCPLDNYP